jgi:S1-C subfamily serine protease
MENMMHDARTSRPVGRVQTRRRLSLARFTVCLSLGVALLSAGCTQADQGYPLSPSQDHVRIPSLAPVVQAVMPAVVHVSAVQRPGRTSVGEENSAGLRRSKHQSADRGLPPAALDELLRRFFGMPEMPIKSSGSGFIIDRAGYVVTDDHVVENAEKVTVTVQDGKRYAARIIGRDPKTDLALLKIDVNYPLPYVGWGDSDTARVGDWVVAIGNLLASSPRSGAPPRVAPRNWIGGSYFPEWGKISPANPPRGCAKCSGMKPFSRLARCLVRAAKARIAAARRLVAAAEAIARR